MAQTREEVTVALGVDNTQLASGLAQSESFMTNFADKIESKFTRKFNKLLYGGLVSTFFNLIKQAMEELLPTAEEFWNSVYGNNDKSTSIFEARRKELRSLREELEKSLPLLEKFFADRKFKRADDGGKVEILNQKIDENRAAQAAEAYARDHSNGEEQAKHVIRINQLIREGIELTDKRDDIQEKMAEKKRAAEEKAAEEKKRADEKESERQKKKAEAEQRHMERIASLREKLAKKSDEEFMPTLKELAESGHWIGGTSGSGWGARRRFIESPFAAKARELQELEEDARDAKIYGNKDRFESDRKRIQSLRTDLSASGVYKDPNQGMIDELAKLTDPITTGKGIPVTMEPLY